MDGSAGSVLLNADGITTILVNDKGALSSKTVALSNLVLSHESGAVRISDQSTGDNVVIKIKSFPFQELMMLIDDASRLLGLR